MDIAGEIYSKPTSSERAVNGRTELVREFSLIFNKANFIRVHVYNADLWDKVRHAKIGNYIHLNGRLCNSWSMYRKSSYTYIELVEVLDLSAGENRFMKKETVQQKRAEADSHKSS